MNLLIIEDDLELREELASVLLTNGYNPSYLEDFTQVTERIQQVNPSLILLDITLGEYSGFDLCRRIRKQSSVPIIFLTGSNDSLDELNALSLGADDFVTKPYHPSILLARIAAVLKRTEPAEEHLTTYKGITLDSRAYKISNGVESAELTKNECRLFSYLMQHQGEVVQRLAIIEYLWDNEVFIDDNTLSVTMTRLRNKLKLLGFSEFIQTKRGVGYQL